MFYRNMFFVTWFTFYFHWISVLGFRGILENKTEHKMTLKSQSSFSGGPSLLLLVLNMERNGHCLYGVCDAGLILNVELFIKIAKPWTLLSVFSLVFDQVVNMPLDWCILYNFLIASEQSRFSHILCWCPAGLVFTPWGEGTFSALVGHPSSDCVRVKISYGADVLWYWPVLQTIFSYWAG